MLIDLKNTEETVMPNFKGGERSFAAKMYFDGETRIMKGRLVPGASIGMHKHEGNCEIIFILSGSGKVIYDGEEISLAEGDCHYCPEGHTHSLINSGEDDLIFYAAVPGPIKSR